MLWWPSIIKLPWLLLHICKSATVMNRHNLQVAKGSSYEHEQWPVIVLFHSEVSLVCMGPFVSPPIRSAEHRPKRSKSSCGRPAFHRNSHLLPCSRHTHNNLLRHIETKSKRTHTNLFFQIKTWGKAEILSKATRGHLSFKTEVQNWWLSHLMHIEASFPFLKKMFLCPDNKIIWATHRIF